MSIPESPVSGQRIKLDKLFVTRSGVLSSRAAEPFEKGMIPFVTAKDVHAGTIDTCVNGFADEMVKKSGIRIVPKHSLLIAAVGPTAGNVALLETDAIVEKNVYYSSGKMDSVDIRYLYYYLSSIKNLIVQSSGGYSKVLLKSISRMNMPVPSLEIQKKITAELDQQITAIDSEINGLRKEISLNSCKKRGNLNKIFGAILVSGDENSSEVITAGYGHLFNIRDCGVIKAGKTPTKSVRQYYGTEFPLFNQHALRQGMNLLVSNTRLSARGLQEARAFEAGTILVCYQGKHLGEAGIARTRGACNASLISITPTAELLPEFLYYQIISAPFQEQMKKKAQNSWNSKADFENLYVAIPSLEKQRHLIAGIEKLFFETDKQLSQLTMQLQTAESLKKTIFNLAFANF